MITPLNQRPNYQANTLNKNSDARVESENKEVKTNENARVKEIADSDCQNDRQSKRIIEFAVFN